MRFLILALLLSTPAYSNPCLDGMRPLLEVAKGCVVQDARKLAKSGENAESIATASMVNCAPLLRPVRDDYDRCTDPDVAIKLKTAFERTLRQIAIAEVVNAKAGR